MPRPFCLHRAACSQLDPAPPATPDTAPPTITPFTPGTVSVPQGQLLTHAAGIGASAWDAVDGVITAVETLGMEAVITSAVSPMRWICCQTWLGAYGAGLQGWGLMSCGNTP